MLISVFKWNMIYSDNHDTNRHMLNNTQLPFLFWDIENLLTLKRANSTFGGSSFYSIYWTLSKNSWSLSNREEIVAWFFLIFRDSSVDHNPVKDFTLKDFLQIVLICRWYTSLTDIGWSTIGNLETVDIYFILVLNSSSLWFHNLTRNRPE